MPFEKDMERAQEELFVDFAKKAKTPQQANQKNKSFFSIPIWAVIQERNVTFSLDIILLFFLTLFLVVCMAFFWGLHRGRILSEKKLISSDQKVMMNLYRNESKPGAITGESVKSTPLEKETSQEEKQSQTSEIDFETISEKSNPSLNTSQQEKTQPPQPKYTIRIASSKDVKATQTMLTKLQKKGFDAFIITAPSKKGRPWNYLCVGHFQNSSEGEGILKKLKKEEGFSDSFFYIL